MNSERPVALLDTDVASYMFKSVPMGWEYTTLLRGYQLGVSFITVAELWFGAGKNGWGARLRRKLEFFLQDGLILPHKPGMEHVYAKVMLDRERAGRRLETADGWIATTAIYYDVPLAVHDSDFLDTPGLRIITASAEVRAAQLRLPVISGRPLNLNASCRCGV
jgi:predicted nucleic acid-binding protein